MVHLQAGAKFVGGLLGSAGIGSAVLCVNIALKLRNYKRAWEEVNTKRNQYSQISDRLESLKAMVEEEAKLTRPWSWRERLFACCTAT